YCSVQAADAEQGAQKLLTSLQDVEKFNLLVEKKKISTYWLGIPPGAVFQHFLQGGSVVHLFGYYGQEWEDPDGNAHGVELPDSSKREQVFYATRLTYESKWYDRESHQDSLKLCGRGNMPQSWQVDFDAVSGPTTFDANRRTKGKLKWQMKRTDALRRNWSFTSCSSGSGSSADHTGAFADTGA
ncbi:unnamed protein product, partial [Amoebophrya sp. A120]